MLHILPAGPPADRAQLLGAPPGVQLVTARDHLIGPRLTRRAIFGIAPDHVGDLDFMGRTVALPGDGSFPEDVLGERVLSFFRRSASASSADFCADPDVSVVLVIQKPGRCFPFLSRLPRLYHRRGPFGS